jgi:serine/threonine-protein kinase
MAQGRFEEALAEVKLAHDLDPLSLIINTVYGSILNDTGRPDEAVQQLRRTLEMDQSFSVATFMLGQVWESRGDFKQAAAAYESAWAANHHPIRNAVLACLYVRMGKEAAARKILDELTSRAQQQYVLSYALALVHLALGDKEKAMPLLEKAYEERGIQIGGNTCSLKIDKRLDALRGDPRFERLLAKYMGETK